MEIAFNKSLAIQIDADVYSVVLPTLQETIFPLEEQIVTIDKDLSVLEAEKSKLDAQANRKAIMYT